MTQPITKENNPRFYEVAHELGLVVEGESKFNRTERRKNGFSRKS